jgi:heme/copper-type cytochrome/quinol oxidase subunit 2
MLQGDDDEAAAEQGWLGQFSSAMILTFVFWTIFALVFASILYGKIRPNNKPALLFSSENRGDSYQRHTDDGGII